MTAEERSWFVSSAQVPAGPEDVCSYWPSGDAQEKLEWDEEAPTSRVICECLGAYWGESVPQNFDNVGNAIAAFFEMCTTVKCFLLEWPV